MDEGLPLVRPLWMMDPHDPACLIVSDEFSVGEELIVAPILHAKRQEREGESKLEIALGIQDLLREFLIHFYSLMGLLFRFLKYFLLFMEFLRYE